MNPHSPRQLFAVGVSLALAAAVGSQVPRAASSSSCQFSGVDRIVAVGDVHGAHDRFVEILRAASVIDERNHWIGGRTHLVQLGDVVDRGPDSLKTLELLDALQREAQRAGGAVHQLLGNHEVMRMLGDLRYVTPGEYEAFTSSKSEEIRDAYVERAQAASGPVSVPPPLGFVEMRIAFGQNGRFGKSMRSHDAVLQMDGIVFVHGGISPALAGLSCDTINEAVRRNLGSELAQTRGDPQAQLATSADGPLWYRGLAEEPDTFATAVDDILTRQKATAIVVGHTVTPDGRVRARFGGKVLQIDTGMQPAYVQNGRASALEINRGTMTAIYADRRDPVVWDRRGPAASAAPAR